MYCNHSLSVHMKCSVAKKYHMGISGSPCVGYSWWKFITKNWVVYVTITVCLVIYLWGLKLLKFWFSVVMSADHINLLSWNNSWEENDWALRILFNTCHDPAVWGWMKSRGSFKFRERKLVSEWLPGLRNDQCLHRASQAYPMCYLMLKNACWSKH